MEIYSIPKNNLLLNINGKLCVLYLSRLLLVLLVNHYKMGTDLAWQLREYY